MSGLERRLARARLRKLRRPDGTLLLAERVVRAIAARAPRGIDELLAVPGVGRATGARYGVAILACFG